MKRANDKITVVVINDFCGTAFLGEHRIGDVSFVGSEALIRIDGFDVEEWDMPLGNLKDASAKAAERVASSSRIKSNARIRNLVIGDNSLTHEDRKEHLSKLDSELSTLLATNGGGAG